jgi:hypothetical protein
MRSKRLHMHLPATHLLKATVMSYTTFTWTWCKAEVSTLQCPRQVQSRNAAHLLPR